MPKSYNFLLYDRRKVPRNKLKGISKDHKRGGGIQDVKDRLDKFFKFKALANKPVYLYR